MQLWLALSAIINVNATKEPNKQFDEKKQKHISELLKNPGLFNFMLSYIKEMKNDAFQIMISLDTMAYLEEWKVGLNELHKLNENQIA